MSNIIEFYKVIQPSDISPHGLALLDGNMSMATPLQLPLASLPKLQVCAITISDRIPNVFNAYPFYEFDNTLLRVSTDVAGSARDIQLPRGLYQSVEEIATAINAAILANTNYYPNAGSVALSIEANIITDQVTLSIDSTKLAPPHTRMTVDLRKSTTGTDLATTLGFSEGTALCQGVPHTKVSFYSNQEIRMDTQGTTCDIHCSVIATRRRNDAFVRTLAIVPFAGKTTVSDNVWPSAGQVSPVLVYEGSKTIKFIQVEVKTMSGKPMVFMGGAIHIIMAFTY